MSMSLVPCADCSRHIRDDEAACPFCGARVKRIAQRRAIASSRPMSRAAVLFVGAAAAAGCGGVETTAGGSDAQASDDERSSDATSDATGVVDAPEDQSMIALYGPAPVDAAPVDAAAIDAGMIPIYGSAIIEGGILPKG
jgi:hypothetical protein